MQNLAKIGAKRIAAPCARDTNRGRAQEGFVFPRGSAETGFPDREHTVEGFKQWSASGRKLAHFLRRARTNRSELKLRPHVHAVFLDGAYQDKGRERRVASAS